MRLREKAYKDLVVAESLPEDQMSAPETSPDIGRRILTSALEQCSSCFRVLR